MIHADFADMRAALENVGVEKVQGVLLDLGVSSYQLDTARRGFSYHADAPLDMRMSSEGMSAKDLVNTWSYEDLRRILYDYGEEKFAPAIAKAIVAAREIKPIETTGELAELVKSSVPQRVRREKNPCKKTFQAVRIAVNDEMGQLDRAQCDEVGRLYRHGVCGGCKTLSISSRIVCSVQRCGRPSCSASLRSFSA